MDYKDFGEDIDPRQMGLMERIAYYAYQAHADFEMANSSLHPQMIIEAEDKLSEMLEMISKVKADIEEPEKITELEKLEKMLKNDYRVYQSENA